MRNWPVGRIIITSELITVLSYGALTYPIVSVQAPSFWIWIDWLIEVFLALLAAWAIWKGRAWAFKAVIVAAAFIGITHPSWVPWRIQAAFGSETVGHGLSYLWLLIISLAQLVALVVALRHLRSDVPAA